MDDNMNISELLMLGEKAPCERSRFTQRCVKVLRLGF